MLIKLLLPLALITSSYANLPRNPIIQGNPILQQRGAKESAKSKPTLASLAEETQSALKLLLPSIFTFGDDIISSSGLTLECNACQTAFSAMRAVTYLGQGPFEDIVNEICIMSGIPESECQGVIHQQAPYVIQAFQSSKNLMGYTGQLACNALLNTCSSFVPKEIPLVLDSLPPRPTFNTSSLTSEPLTLLHLSDIHYDPNYEAGTESICRYAMCCEKMTNPPKQQILRPASDWGEYLCDTPRILIEDFIENFQQTTQLKPDLTIFTGDIAPHNVWYNNATTLQQAYEIFDLFKELPSNLYSTIGNHDTTPLNLFEPIGLVKNGSEPANNWVYNNLSSLWSEWLSTSVSEMLTDGQGVYSVRPFDGLKIINMNTNDCYSLNLYNYYNDASEADPNGQLQWIANELADSEAGNEAVWLMSHVPPGNPDCIIPWSNAFQKIVERYSKTIKAQFYGHTHFDEFSVQYDRNKTNPISYQLWAPSFTPYSNLNAGYRMYKIHPQSFEILDSLTYFANISDAANWTQPKWELEYSARDYYPEWPNDAPLNATFWDTVVNALETDDDLFHQYYFRRSKGSPADGTCNDNECKQQILQNLRAANSKDKYYPPIIQNAKTLTDMVRKIFHNGKPSMFYKRQCSH